MKSKVLRFANGILATLIALLGFSSCGKSSNIECIYGGPDMMDRSYSEPEEKNSTDSLSIDSLKNSVNKSEQPQ